MLDRSVEVEDALGVGGQEKEFEMSLFRIAMPFALTALLASTAHAQSGYYGPAEAFPRYPVTASTPVAPYVPTHQVNPPTHGWPPAHQYPANNHPARWYPTRDYAALAANPVRPDSTQPSPSSIPLPPSPVPQGEGTTDAVNVSSSGLLDQMLAEASVADQTVAEPTADGMLDGTILAEVDDPSTDVALMAHVPGDTSCGACGQVLPGCRSPWYASISTLVMGRNRPNKLWTSHQSPPPAANAANFLLNTHTPGFEWHGGNEVRFGRRFGGGPWALEAQYWTLYPIESRATASNAAGVSSMLDVSEVLFNATSGTEWFDNALRHRVERRNEVHNVELNMVRFGSLFAHPDARWTADWSFGLRYFRFQESLSFSTNADPARAVFVANPAFATTAVLDDRITNNLFGIQVGCQFDYRLFSRWSFFAKPQIGLYNNRIKHEFHARLTDGTPGVPDPLSGRTGTYPVESTVDAFSVLTQLDLGLDWQIGENWAVQGGYRMMVATGMGLSDHQIPDAIVNIHELRDIDRNGELILHGAFLNVICDY